MTPSSTYMRNHAKCPFYRGDTQQSVICEGFLPDSTVSVRFATRRDMQRHCCVFCCDKYENCEVYRMVCEACGYDA